MKTNPDVQSTAAAKLALLAIHVLIGSDSSEPLVAYIIQRDSKVLTREEVVRALAATPKPVACMGVRRDRVIEVSCSQINDGSAVREHEAEIRAFEEPSIGFMALMRKGAADDSGGILVIGNQERELVDSESFARWYREYAIPDHVSIGSRPPTAEEKSIGASYVLLLSKGRQL